MNRFTLQRARPSGATGIGANGAGGTGGPLVSGIADYVLEGDPAQLRSYANQEVRVTARVDSRLTAADQQGGGTRAGGSQAASPATTGRAESQGAATGAASDARILTVESVTRVASVCPE